MEGWVGDKAQGMHQTGGRVWLGLAPGHSLQGMGGPWGAGTFTVMLLVWPE